MSANPNDPIDRALGAVEAPSAMSASMDSGETSYPVRFSNFWSSSRARNSFDLTRRGEIEFSGAGVVVRGFRREMPFMGTRIEIVIARADIADVSQLGNFVNL